VGYLNSGDLGDVLLAGKDKEVQKASAANKRLPTGELT
jgi:hypothetical protein